MPFNVSSKFFNLKLLCLLFQGTSHASQKLKKNSKWLWNQISPPPKNLNILWKRKKGPYFQCLFVHYPFFYWKMPWNMDVSLSSDACDVRKEREYLALKQSYLVIFLWRPFTLLPSNIFFPNQNSRVTLQYFLSIMHLHLQLARHCSGHFSNTSRPCYKIRVWP